MAANQGLIQSKEDWIKPVSRRRGEREKEREREREHGHFLSTEQFKIVF